MLIDIGVPDLRDEIYVNCVFLYYSAYFDTFDIENIFNNLYSFE